VSLDLTLFTSTFVTLIVILDPPGAIPIFLALTGPLTPKQKVAAARRASLVALGVIASFAVFGQKILDYLHISLPALQGAGGLLLLIVALQLLTGSESEQLADAGVNVALVPLGTPLLAGPGAIVATMLFVEEIDGTEELTAVALGIVGVHLALWAAMRFSLPILRVIREGGVLLVTRIAGLLLSAIAVQLIADSVRAFIAGEG
jgi:multiple antibiotic resistance protein